MNIVSVLKEASRDRSNAVALVDDAGRSLTYREWLHGARHVAAGLRASELDTRRVLLAFTAADALDYAIALVGVMGVGGTAVPVTLPAPSAALRRVAEAVDASSLVTSRDLDIGLRSRTTAALCASGELELRDDFEAEDPAQILLSSGTTGVPKAVVVPHGNLAWVPFNSCAASERREHLVHAFPFGSSAFQSQLIRTITLDYTVRMLGVFIARRLIHILESSDVTTLVLVPAMVSLLLREAGASRSFGGLECVGMTGSFPRARDYDALARLFPRAAVRTSYGSTEASPAGTSGPYDPERPLAVGRPNQGCELAIGDEPGDEPAAGVPGNVWLRAVGATPRRYLDDEPASSFYFRDGWVRMGDLGYVDGDGSLVLTGRASEVISVGGVKVSIPEVEAVLAQSEGIRDVAAFPHPHEILGEVVAVDVVREPWATEAEIEAFARAHLPPPGVPMRYRFVSEIPRNAMGKVERPAGPAPAVGGALRRSGAGVEPTQPGAARPHRF